MHARLRGSESFLTLFQILNKPDFPSLADEIAEPHPDMNIKVAAFTVSEKSSNTNGHFDGHIPADRRMEYLVKTVKTHLKHMYSNKTEKNIVKRTSVIATISDISERYDSTTNVIVRTERLQTVLLVEMCSTTVFTDQVLSWSCGPK